MGLLRLFKRKKRVKLRRTEHTLLDNGRKTDYTLQNSTDDAIRSSEEQYLPSGEAVDLLRDRIIAEIAESPKTEYQLGSLLLEDARCCFPSGKSFQRDGAWFFLDLQTGRLRVDVSAYPNTSGPCPQDSFPLTALEFYQIAKRYSFIPELQSFRSEQDWESLFDDRLKAAVSNAIEARRQKEEERWKKIKDEIKNTDNRTIILRELSERKPQMNIVSADIDMIFGDVNRGIKLTNEKDSYLIKYYYRRTDKSGETKEENKSRNTTPTESVWVEEEFEKAIEDRRYGEIRAFWVCNHATVRITRTGKEEIFFNCGDFVSTNSENLDRVKNYNKLRDKLEHLVYFGSKLFP